jgi:ABC-type oligopeptide transport system ATPase subunit
MGTSQSDIAIAVESLRKVFPGRKGSPRVEAVAGIDLTVQKGEIL